jgi:hypothetical protein
MELTKIMTRRKKRTDKREMPRMKTQQPSAERYTRILVPVFLNPSSYIHYYKIYSDLCISEKRILLFRFNFIKYATWL